MSDDEKRVRIGTDERQKVEKSRVLTMKYGKQQMSDIRRKMQVENWIDDSINNLFSGRDDHNVQLDLDFLLSLPSAYDRREHILHQLTRGNCPADHGTVAQLITALEDRIKGL